MSFEALSTIDTSAIISVWQELGYNQEEQEAEQKRLNEIVVSAVQSYQESLEQTRDSMKRQITETQDLYSKMMHAFGKTEEEVQTEINSEAPTLKERLESIDAKFSVFKETNNSIVERFKSLHSQCKELYDLLEVTERGEYGAVGDSDFTAARIARFEEKLKSLKGEVANRESVMINLKKESTKISKELEIEMPDSLKEIFDSNKITKEAIQQADNFQKELLKKKEDREAELSIKVSALNKLWNIFHVPQSDRTHFFSSFTTIGDSVITAYDEEIKKLREQREERLPEIVEQQKEEIKNLEQELHLTPENIEEIQTEGKNLNDVYDLLDQKYETLSKELLEAKPIIETIKQRDELLNEISELNEAQKKMELSLKKKKTVDQKKAAKDEQSRRRIKSLLPRIEKKLLINLIEYQTRKGKEFLWSGKEIIHELDHIKLSDVEMQKAKGSRKKSMTSRRTSQFSAVSVVVSSKKGAVRKSLENQCNMGNQQE